MPGVVCLLFSFNIALLVVGCWRVYVRRPATRGRQQPAIYQQLYVAAPGQHLEARGGWMASSRLFLGMKL